MINTFFIVLRLLLPHNDRVATALQDLPNRVRTRVVARASLTTTTTTVVSYLLSPLPGNLSVSLLIFLAFRFYIIKENLLAYLFHSVLARYLKYRFFQNGICWFRINPTIVFEFERPRLEDQETTKERPVLKLTQNFGLWWHQSNQPKFFGSQQEQPTRH